MDPPAASAAAAAPERPVHRAAPDDGRCGYHARCTWAGSTTPRSCATPTSVSCATTALQRAASYLGTLRGTARDLYAERAALVHESDRPIGTLTAYRYQIHHGTADIGILMGERRGVGAGPRWRGFQAARRLAGPQQPGMRKLTCGTLSANHGDAARWRPNGPASSARPCACAQELVDGQPADIVYFARFTAAARQTAVPLAHAA